MSLVGHGPTHMRADATINRCPQQPLCRAWVQANQCNGASCQSAPWL